MTYNGARGTTREAMARTLGYDSLELEAINKSYLNLLSYLGGADPKIRLNIANSLWIREGAPIKEDFIDRNQEYFQAQVEALDFSKAAAVEQINNWISQATQGKIQRMLEPPFPPMWFCTSSTPFTLKASGQAPLTRSGPLTPTLLQAAVKKQR